MDILTLAMARKIAKDLPDDLEEKLDALLEDIRGAYLLDELVIGATSTIVYNEDGSPKKVVHRDENNVELRVDEYTITDTTFTEKRTVQDTGENLTIITNLDTGETSVEYSET